MDAAALPARLRAAVDLPAWRRRLRLGPLTVIQAQVFLAGAGVMALEMLGSRLLAPRFGSTIFTWGALIGVVMTALAAGYYLGGRAGDRWPHGRMLSGLLFAGGAFALSLPLLGPAMLAGVAAAIPDPQWGPLVASLLLVGPPSLVLGAATPVAVRLAAGPSERAGTTAGSMAGLSTAGSILGTFVTVFVLIPAFDVAAILTGSGFLLAAAALLGADRRRAFAGALGVLAILSPAGQAVFADTLTTLSTGASGEVLHKESTLYHELLVVQSGTGPGAVRTLLLDGHRHSAMYLDRPADTPFRYVEYFHLGPLLAPDAARALFVGGGGMSGPKQFLLAYPGMQVDVVEVDPAVVRAAEAWFEVPDDPRLTVHAEDARRFLQAAEGTWDVIVLDAYGRTYVPFHLMTAEFHALVREHLAPGGVVVTNLIGAQEGEASMLLRSEARTMAAVFPWTRVAGTRATLGPFESQNWMLVASGAEPPGWPGAGQRAPAWEAEKGRAYPAMLAALQEGALRTDDVPILTDGFAPVERFLSPLTMRPYDPEG